MGRTSQIQHVIYRYNGDPNTEDKVKNPAPKVFLPRPGAVIERRGKQWKVVATNEDFVIEEQKAIPILRIFLSDNL